MGKREAKVALFWFGKANALYVATRIIDSNMKTETSLLRNRRREAAFSIAEVTCGMAILGTVVAALMTGFTSGMFTMQMARENLRATQIMLERMETIRLYSWDQVCSNGFITTNFTAYYDPNSTNQGTAYTGSITLTPAPISSSYSNEMKLVKVKLDWKTGNLSRTREFSSYISRNGIQNYIY
jgi:type II secretory pathway pseudopilin PulG